MTELEIAQIAIELLQLGYVDQNGETLTYEECVVMVKEAHGVCDDDCKKKQAKPITFNEWCESEEGKNELTKAGNELLDTLEKNIIDLPLSKEYQRGFEEGRKSSPSAVVYHSSACRCTTSNTRCPIHSA